MNEQEIERLFKAGQRVVQRDGLLLDERRWDEWLEQYLPDCVFWVPMWNDENTINDNTDNGLSHFFYESRKGLEDRVVRIVSGKSPASSPLPRTAHLVSHLDFVDPPTAERMTLRVTWACHVLFVRGRAQHVYFGRSEYQLVPVDGHWRIAVKKVQLQNDDIPSLLDIYCV